MGESLPSLEGQGSPMQSDQDVYCKANKVKSSQFV